MLFNFKSPDVNKQHLKFQYSFDTKGHRTIKNESYHSRVQSNRQTKEIIKIFDTEN